MAQVTEGLSRAAAEKPGGIAIKYADRQRTWAELLARVERMAGGFRGLGLAPNDRVAIWTLNSDRYLDLLYAVPWAGGVVVPINTRLTAAEVGAILADADCAVLVVDEMSHPLAASVAGQARNPTLVYAGEGSPPLGTIGIDALAEGTAIPDAGRRTEDLYGIFYTGGTTGRSKGVMLSHRNIIANLDNLVTFFERIAPADDPDPVYLHVAPMFHLADLGSTFYVTQRLGTHAIVPRFDPAETLRAIVAFRVTTVMMVPTMLNMVLQLPEFGSHDLSTLRYLTYGASPMPPAVMERAMEVLPQVRFIQGYGMTELSPVATCLAPEDHRPNGSRPAKLTSAGRPVGTAEVRVVDEQDRPVPVGTVGEIVVRGPMVMQGYWKRPDLTAQAVREGWMHTGDAGYFDEDGFLFIVDRVKDMIITGGENVYSVEVESVLYDHPAVAMCAVFAVPSERWGEAVHAVVVPKPGSDPGEDELIGFCRDRIAGYKCPSSIELRRAPLPISGAGKILKTELRAPHWAGMARQVH
jgi:long-chain acyl-CoA synthetase